MELKQHYKTVQELTLWVSYLIKTNLFLFVIIFLLVTYLFLQHKIVLIQIPGSGGDQGQVTYTNGVVELTSQKAIVLATVNAISQINSANYQYEKIFIQSFLSPEIFTSVSSQIDAQVKKMLDQHELGSFYFEFKDYFYDPVLNLHFVKGDIHTVNAIKNTSQSWIYELSMHVDNYRPLITSMSTYPGIEFHNSSWIEKQSKSGL